MSWKDVNLSFRSSSIVIRIESGIGGRSVGLLELELSFFPVGVAYYLTDPFERGVKYTLGAEKPDDMNTLILCFDFGVLSHDSTVFSAILISGFSLNWGRLDLPVVFATFGSGNADFLAGCVIFCTFCTKFVYFLLNDASGLWGGHGRIPALNVKSFSLVSFSSSASSDPSSSIFYSFNIIYSCCLSSSCSLGNYNVYLYSDSI